MGVRCSRNKCALPLKVSLVWLGLRAGEDKGEEWVCALYQLRVARRLCLLLSRRCRRLHLDNRHACPARKKLLQPWRPLEAPLDLLTHAPAPSCASSLIIPRACVVGCGLEFVAKTVRGLCRGAHLVLLRGRYMGGWVCWGLHWWPHDKGDVSVGGVEGLMDGGQALASPSFAFLPRPSILPPSLCGVCAQGTRPAGPHGPARLTTSVVCCEPAKPATATRAPRQKGSTKNLFASSPIPPACFSSILHPKSPTNPPTIQPHTEYNHGGQGPRDHPISEIHPQRPLGTSPDGT